MLRELILMTDDGKKSPTDMLKTFKSYLKSDNENTTSWYKLLKHFTRDEMDQNDLLDSLLDFCKGDGKKFGPLIQYFIQFLYEVDVIEEGPLTDWYDAVMEFNTKGEDSDYTANDVKLAKQCEKFIDWLRNAEEEEESDDESSEEED
jgi:translation initiation factor eIF-2B subunit epsilon